MRRPLRLSAGPLLALALVGLAPLAGAQESGSQPASATPEAPAAAPTEPVPGTAELILVEGIQGIGELDERITIESPGEVHDVRWVFSNRGGTLYSASMLSERYWQHPDTPPPSVPVPPDKLKGGEPCETDKKGKLRCRIDVVTTWHPRYLPYRVQFSELDVEGAVVRLVRKSATGKVEGGKLLAPNVRLATGDNAEASVDLEVDRRVVEGDLFEATAPAALTGKTWTVRSVTSSGAVEFTEPLPEGAFEGVAYTIVRKGTFEELWKIEEGFTTFSRVSESPGLPLVYVWPDPATDTSPVFVEKRFDRGDQGYGLRLSVTIHNFADRDAKVGMGLRVAGFQSGAIEGGNMFIRPTRIQAASCLTGEDLERYEYPSLVDEEQPPAFATETRWVGTDTLYFLLAAAPENMSGTQCRLRAFPVGQTKSGVVTAELLGSSVATIKGTRTACTPAWLKLEGRKTCEDAAALLGAEPDDRVKELKTAWQKARTAEGADQAALDGAWEALTTRSRAIYRFRLYTGPKDPDRLVSSNLGLEEAMDYGILGFISKTMHALLRWFHSWAGHWAFAIILLTILVKGLLLPLTNKSFSHMQKMQKLKPEMDALKKKHGSDKQKFQQEMMAMYKRHGVNPLTGCFPMLLQMPIWIALYQTIGTSVELFHAPMGLWINDLSAPDPLYIMPVLLGVLMLVQSHLTTSTGSVSGAQAKFLKYGMPVMFAGFMLFLPAGLVLYILVNTSLTIVQNIFIRRRLA